MALLARLELEPGEEDFYAAQLSGILAHIDRLAELDTGSVEPTAQVIETKNVMREDEPRPCLGAERALANAPAHADGMIVVRTILDPEP